MLGAMDRAMIEKHLAQAERHVAEGERHITRQRRSLQSLSVTATTRVQQRSF
jgi:hypothetical protein